ncbi:MAG: alpha/beta hydrolase family protein [Acidimicrobiales bacterium]
MSPRTPPSSPSGPGALLLTPGAGSSADHPTLVAIEKGVAPLPVARIDFPYRKEGRRAPDRAPKLVACVVDEAEALARRAGVAGESLVLGGRSMGGRMCSMAVADGLPAAGLVLLSYPLHPPGKPEKMRTDHFPALDLPCLFVCGTRDPFGTPDELTEAVAAIPGPVTLRWLDGGRHDVKGRDDEIVALVADWLASLSDPPGRPAGRHPG